MPAEYIPDFVVRLGDDCHLVETKAQNQLSQPNVVRKKRAEVRWVEKINALEADKPLMLERVGDCSSIY